MSHILITGAGGYIGTTLVPIMLSKNHEVTAVDTFVFGRSFLPKHHKLNCFQADIRTISADIFESVDTVIDMAAMSNDPCGQAFETDTWEINHQARVRNARLAKDAGVKRYLLISSCSVYGSATGVLSESSETSPLTTYARANLAAERDILPLATQDYCVTALRLATLFGYSPRMRLDVAVNTMCYHAWRNGEIHIAGAGTQTRPLLHVGDAAEAISRISDASAKAVNSKVINIGNNQMNHTINDIGETVSKFFLDTEDKQVHLHHSGPQDLRSYWVNFSRLQSILHWTPGRTINHELHNVVTFLKSATQMDLKRCFTLDWYRHVGSRSTSDKQPIGHTDD